MNVSGCFRGLHHRFPLLATTMALGVALPSSSPAQTQALDWAACVREAAKASPALVQAREKVTQTEEARTITASGGRPSVSSSAKAGRSDSEGGDGPNSSYSYGASASQLLFDGGKTRAQVAAADEDILSAGLDYRISSAELRYALRSSFISLLRAQDLVRVTEDILKRREQTAGLIRLRYEAGREHKGALMTAEAKYEQAKADLRSAGRNLELTQRQLARRIGWTNFIPVAAAGSLEIRAVDNPPPPSFEAIADSNPAIARIASATRTAALDVKSARAGFLPSIDAGASVGRSSSEWPPEEDSWSVGVSLSLPLFESGSRVAQVRKARAALRSAQAGEQDERTATVMTLASAWTAWQNAIDTVAVQRRFLEATQERAKIGAAQYSNGLINFDTWIIIEDESTQAERNYLNAQAEALDAEAAWNHAKGGTLEDDIH